MQDNRTTKKRIYDTYNTYNYIINPVTGEVKTRKQRSRSFKRFNRDVEEVLKGQFSYESCFDLLTVVSQLDIRIIGSIGETGVYSYCIKTMDGKFSMGNKSLIRALLTFVQKTLPIPGIYTEKQIKRIKCIIRMNTVLGQIRQRKQEQERMMLEDDLD